MDDAAPQNPLKLMTQLDMVIEIIRLKRGGVCGKCNHMSQDHHHCTMLCIYVVRNSRHRLLVCGWTVDGSGQGY